MSTTVASYYLFLSCLSLVQPVVKSKIFGKSCNTDIFWDIHFTNLINFQPFEAVCRGIYTTSIDKKIGLNK